MDEQATDTPDRSGQILEYMFQSGAVADAHVTSGREEGYTGYVVLRMMDSPRSSLERLAGAIEKENGSIRLYAVSNIPRRDDGSVDEATLEHASRESAQCSGTEEVEVRDRSDQP